MYNYEDSLVSSTGLSARGISRASTLACRLVGIRWVGETEDTGDIGDIGDIGEVGTVVNVGDGLLNIVVNESLVPWRSETKSMIGVGSAWKVVSTFDRSSSCTRQKRHISAG